ncbi:MAG TPA: UDP-N-acetylmuramate--L-alanine ligase [Gemmatimonadetes bacterium]|nr:UDP-N-acetylmuramate--L-alanine ligase [Gemmatimonadota bacterium]
METNIVMAPETSPKFTDQVDRSNHTHFMGIEGAGMFALAELFRRRGCVVSGCDLAPGENSEQLKLDQVEIYGSHHESHLSGVNTLVVSSAIPWTAQEIQEAIRLEIPVLKRAEALGQCINHGEILAVSGTHGKTTTTAMATEILDIAGLNPTGIAGGYVFSWGGNLRHGGDLYVVEADEYDRSFLELKPDIAVVTNIEEDHLDCYRDLDEIISVFGQFLGSLPSNGTAVVCGDDRIAGRVMNGLEGRKVSYGLNPGAQLRATEVHQSDDGVSFSLLEQGINCGHFRIKSLGLHNLQNSLAAVASSRCLGVSWEAIREGLRSYEGVKRRFEIIGFHRDILIVDDYAHHPSEVTATLVAARQAYPNRRIVALFQPHLFTRTKDFASDFGESLLVADEIWITDVFASREDPIEGVTGGLIASSVEQSGRTVRYHADMNTLSESLIKFLTPGDLIITLGAGSIRQVSEEIKVLLQSGGFNE